MAAKTRPFKIFLGSSSKSRKDTLTEMGYDFTIMNADIDEKEMSRFLCFFIISRLCVLTQQYLNRTVFFL
ncbi:hypothetical protein MKX03_010288 [Papaver bracteatum]|nr:hypothetical protein MKX03_010288 [Papaver bracteatum]